MDRLPGRDEGGGFSFSFAKFGKFRKERPSGSTNGRSRYYLWREREAVCGARGARNRRPSCRGLRGVRVRVGIACASQGSACARRVVFELCGFDLAVARPVRRCVDALAASTSPGTAQALVSALVMLSVRTGRVRTRRARRKSPASSPVDVPRRDFPHCTVRA